ncbi:putative ABC transport system permease protein [Leucobacter luti]|uniref:ABC transporter permease n=1 Tax=Leucobacter luti TaxID=340320 RepID=UPI0010497FEE|nr:ABC transporter permease [Leucobacter luti]MCW2289449.1 putative ABC transport system permease protein [Leucobacter luti]TCK40008.1 putative ABC transport system permease protein [Leucobacter luti]
MIGALELGLLYGVMALGVYLTFRVLNFPDLTVDGSFTTGAAVAAALITAEQNPIVATLAGGAAGLVAGAITGLLHTKGRIDGLLAGILTMIALWSINLRIMGKANLPLLRAETVFTPLKDAEMLGTWVGIAIIIAGVLVLKFVIDWFLSTDLGLAIQATGNNEQMIRSFGVNTDGTKILTLSLSNGLVALCGALVAQYQGFADISMGIGLILVGLASVILGQAIFGQRFIWLASLAVILGAVLYRLIIFFALQAGLNPNDMKLVTAVLVVAALLLPRWGFLKRVPTLRGRGGRVPPNTDPGAPAPGSPPASVAATAAADSAPKTAGS